MSSFTANARKGTTPFSDALLGLGHRIRLRRDTSVLSVISCSTIHGERALDSSWAGISSRDGARHNKAVNQPAAKSVLPSGEKPTWS